MLLEKTGIRIELTDPADIAHHKRMGWLEVKEAKPASKSKKADSKSAAKEGEK